jgi:hypothetical protein
MEASCRLEAVGMTAEDYVSLTDEQLDRLADLVAVRVAAVKPPAEPMLTVENVCAMFQVSRAWVYENAGRLGGFKLGPGERAPLRFDPARVRSAFMPLARRDSGDESKHVRRRRSAHLHPVYDG